MNHRLSLSVAIAACALLPATASASDPYAPQKVTLDAAPQHIIEALNAMRSGEMQGAGPHTGLLGSLMYRPQLLELSAEKPAHITTEPRYEGAVLYGTLDLGNDPDATRHTIAFVRADDGQAVVYADLNNNGDLTDDGDGSWSDVNKREDSPHFYTLDAVFEVSYHGTDETSPVGLRIYHRDGDESMYYYRTGARHGTVMIDGEELPVTLVDQTSRGVYSTGFDLEGGFDPTRTEGGLQIFFGPNSYDACGTFMHNNVNYLARASADGRTLIIEPTPRVILSPQAQAALERREAEEAKSRILQPGQEVPEFSAVMHNGDPLDLSAYLGKKVVVLDLWASWCGPCKVGLRHMNTLAQHADPDEVVFIALNVQDSSRGYNAFVDANADVAYHFARDPIGRGDDSIARSVFGVRGIPATFVIGLDGKIKATIQGATTDDDRLDKALEELGVTLAVAED